MTTKPELEVPNDALTSARHVANMYERFGVIDEGDVLEIATPVVVAYLRKLAPLMDESDDAKRLLAWADELDGGAS